MPPRPRNSIEQRLNTQRRWNFWDSYASDEEHEVRLFNHRVMDDGRRDFTNLLHPETFNNHDENVLIERWYARADHPISLEILARTVVTLTMGSAWVREISMDHLFVRNGDLMGERCDLMLPIRQYAGVRVAPSQLKNPHGSGRIWVHLVVAPYLHDGGW